MTLRLDSRAGSAEFYAPLVAAGLSPTLDIMPSGDVEIMGCGPGGRPLMVGVEFKTVRDVLECVRSGRFAEQARGMRARYEVRWLLIEGEWQTEDGLLEVRERRGYRERGRYTLQEVVAWVLTMAQSGGVLTWRTRDRAESVAWLRALYWWWTSKDFEEHRAHLQWYTPPLTDANPFEEPTLVQKVAAILPGIGAERALAASDAFGSVREMVNADELAWSAIDGIGAKTARKVVEAVR
jgi:ERCC4-type nuclease